MLLSTHYCMSDVTVYTQLYVRCYCLHTTVCQLLLSTHNCMSDVTVYTQLYVRCYCIHTTVCQMLLSTQLYVRWPVQHSTMGRENCPWPSIRSFSSFLWAQVRNCCITGVCHISCQLCDVVWTYRIWVFVKSWFLISCFAHSTNYCLQH
jgi:hypothetical protein